jgi:F0F1-type ATP synthase membrane subunit b/b'
MLHQDASFRVDTHANGSDYANGLTAHQSQGLELQQQLQRLEEIIVLDGLKIPLTQRTIVDEEQLLSQLLAVERSIPDTIRSAENILHNKEEIISRANQYAQELIQSAEQRAAQIADELTIIQQAEMEGQHLRKQVQSEVETIRQRNISEVERVRRQTQQEIDVMRQAAQAECEQIQQEADRYVEQVLKELEDRLGHMTRVVQNGRSHLHSSAG